MGFYVSGGNLISCVYGLLVVRVLIWRWLLSWRYVCWNW